MPIRGASKKNKPPSGSIHPALVSERSTPNARVPPDPADRFANQRCSLEKSGRGPSRPQVGYCMIGAGATIIDKVSICDHVIVGAGSVVISDIVERGTYVGVPARKLS